MRKEEDTQNRDAGEPRGENHQVMARAVRSTRDVDMQVLEMAIALAALVRAAAPEDHEEMQPMTGWMTLWVTLVVIWLWGMITLLSGRSADARSSSSRCGTNADPSTDDLADGMTVSGDCAEARESRAEEQAPQPIKELG